MTAKESARNEWAKLKDRPWQEKAAHLLTYYWGYFAAAIILIAVVTTFTINRLTAKEFALQGFFAHAVADEAVMNLYEEGFAAVAGIDLNEFDIIIEANSDSNVDEPELSYNDGELATVRIGSGMTDLFGGDLTAMMTYAYGGYFGDLSQWASPEQLEAWEPYLLYMDRALYEEIARAIDPMAVYALPEPMEPETMQEPFPFAIMVPADNEVRKAYGFYCTDLAIGIVVNANHADNAVAFLDYMMR